MEKIATILILLCATTFAQDNADTADVAKQEPDSMQTLVKDVDWVLKRARDSIVGVRSKAEIMQVISARVPSLKNIYNKYLKLKPDFSGKVILKFTIAPNGKISSISIVSSTTGYAEFDDAIKDMVATWKWKVIKSGNTTAMVPFNFTE